MVIKVINFGNSKVIEETKPAIATVAMAGFSWPVCPALTDDFAAVRKAGDNQGDNRVCFSLQQMASSLPADRRFKFKALFGAGLGTLLLTGVLISLPWMDGLENLTRDGRFLVRGTRPVQAPIVVVEIDQESLEEEKEPLIFWGPQHARVFSTLNDLGAKAIGFDMVQPVGLFDSKYIDSGSNPDRVQAEVLASLPTVVLSLTRNVLPDGKIVETVPNQQLQTASILGGGRLAFANMTFDSDGVVRSLTLTDFDKNRALALEVASVATGHEPKFTRNSLQLGQTRVALEPEQKLLINYLGGDKTFPRVSYRDLLANPQKFRAQIQNSICFIGVTSPHLPDFHATPFSLGQGSQISTLMAGVEIHANIAHTLLTGQTLHRTAPNVTWFLIGLAVLLSAPCCWIPRISLALFSLMALGVGWIVLCIVAFSTRNWQWPMVPVLTALSFNAVFLIVARLRWESAQKRWVQGVFGRYVSPQVLNHLLQAPGAIELGGKRQMITVLFSDIRGFTQLSEQLEPEQVTHLLNIYLGEMVEIVFHHKGTIDKYIGDAIMAVWNWPLEDAEHALNAIHAAVQMQKTLEKMQEKWQAEGLPKLQIGIGIHSGPAILGNIGSPRRMEQTAIGDTVNVASRLEGLNKTVGPQFGSYILISETTLEAAGLEGIVKSALVADFQVMPAGETEIRGRLQKMKLYAIIAGLPAEESEKSC